MKHKKLSTREKAVINLLSKGFSNKKIGVILEIEAKTVSTYVQRIREKLGLDKDSNIYLVVATYQKLKFPIQDND